MNQHEVYRTNMSDIMTENEATTKSQLAPHRFVPYHFKGLTKAQQDEIMATESNRLLMLSWQRKMKTPRSTSGQFRIWLIPNTISIMKLN